MPDLRPRPSAAGVFVSIALTSLAARAAAQAPPGYYASVDATSPASLRATLHAVIDDHVKYPYSSTSATDTWNILELADEDPANAANVLDVYKNASYPKAGAGNSNYDREHTWPNSYGFPNDGASNYPYSDCHGLMLADGGYNSSRGNKPYRACPSGCIEKVTDVNGGTGGGSGVYPGHSNWSSGIAGTAGSWETWDDRRGDVARAILYFDVRYEGGVHGVTGAAEPDLRVTDDEALIAASNTGVNESVAYMGMRSVLVQWHIEDPVDARELARNDVVYSFQGNRNPFVDHPEWVAPLFGGQPLLSGTPATLNLFPGGAQALALAGGANHAGNLYFLAGTTEGTAPGFDFGGQHIPLNPFGAYFSMTLAGPGALLAPHLGFLNGFGNASAAFSLPAGLSPTLAGITVHHAYVTLNGALNLNGVSNAAAVTLTHSIGTPRLVINEIDYDQPGTDTAEYVEIFNAGDGDQSLANAVLEFWNGADNTIYRTVALSAAGPTLPAGGYLVVRSSAVSVPPSALSVLFTGAQDNIQNGAPDGLKLKDGALVLDSMSYEGVMPGVTEGAAGAGTDSPSGTMSLARSPNGVDSNSNAADFAVTATLTPGAANL
jgi:endonuclease I